MARNVDQALFLSEEAFAKKGVPALTPPLKWAGGKRWLGPILRPLYAPHRRRLWVEPFVGGLGATLSVMPEEALLSDVNPHLINFYWWLQRGFSIKIPMENAPEVYYAHRTRFNELIRKGEIWTEEAASLFYYLNRTGYNGLCRFNRKGEFNVPFGRYGRIPYIRDFSPYVSLLGRWRFVWADFRTFLGEVPEGAFIYADPPYDVEFREYSAGGFSWEDQVELAQRLALHPGPVVLSGQATPRILELYERLGFG
ncbi:MAG: DNA adenine methylase, partial [Thermaceae bacterium]